MFWYISKSRSKPLEPRLPPRSNYGPSIRFYKWYDEMELKFGVVYSSIGGTHFHIVKPNIHREKPTTSSVILYNNSNKNFSTTR